MVWRIKLKSSYNSKFYGADQRNVISDNKVFSLIEEGEEYHETILLPLHIVALLFTTGFIFTSVVFWLIL